MGMREFVDVLHELLAVDTVEGLVKSLYAAEDKITVVLSDGAEFVVSVEKT